MTRAIVYSHDTYGLGNIRRMLTISRQLTENLPDLSVLLITGSPLIHSFTLPQRLDYIKLPCLRRTEADQYASKYLRVEDQELAHLRAVLIRDAVESFVPDVVIVDKKPYGVGNELVDTLGYLHQVRPETRHVLVLRDILDSPRVTIQTWKQNKYFEAIDLYDRILVLGCPEIFDACHEYRFPADAASKVRYCGYTCRKGIVRDRLQVRRELGVADDERLVLVTTGGGEDGAFLLRTFLDAEPLIVAGRCIKALIIDGPEIPESHRNEIRVKAARHAHVTFVNFTEDILSLMNAADLVVSMGGYNTICEILTLGKRAIVIPRSTPVQEQRIRAERMSNLGLFKAVYPEQLSAGLLAREIFSQLDSGLEMRPSIRLDLDALPKIAGHVRELLSGENARTTTFVAPGADGSLTGSLPVSTPTENITRTPRAGGV